MDGSIAKDAGDDTGLFCEQKEPTRSQTSHYSTKENMRLVTDSPHNRIAEDIGVVDETLDAGMRAQRVVALDRVRVP